jgi:hypothetical protein
MVPPAPHGENLYEIRRRDPQRLPEGLGTLWSAVQLISTVSDERVGRGYGPKESPSVPALRGYFQERFDDLETNDREVKFRLGMLTFRLKHVCIGGYIEPSAAEVRFG